MIICHCRAVSDRAIRKAVREGAQTPRQVFESCGAGRSCGGCAPAVSELIEAETAKDLAFTAAELSPAG